MTKGLDFFLDHPKPWSLEVACEGAVASSYVVRDANGVPVIDSGDGDSVLHLPPVGKMRVFVDFVNNN